MPSTHSASDPVQRVLSRCQGVRSSGSGWTARCPSHDDRRASLSIREGNEGRVLLKCFAGCEYAAIMAALELQPGEGFTPRERPASTHTRSGFDSLESAVDYYRRTIHREVARWQYRDARGNSIGLALRFNNRDGTKQFRPVFIIDGKWHPTFLKPRPLYGLELLAQRTGECVYLAEGEKCADKLRELGLLGVSCCGGAESPAHTDLSPLAGREVVLLPDCDTPGRKHAEGLRTLLAKLHKPPSKCAIIELPGLTDKEDIVEFVERVHAGDAAAAKEQLEERVAIALESTAAAPEWPEGWEPSSRIVDGLKLLERPEVVHSGFAPWDAAQPFGGLEHGTVCILSAPPGCFKTTLMLRLALGYAEQGHRVAWLACEMKPRALLRRIVANRARCTPWHLVNERSFRDAGARAIEELRPVFDRLHIRGGRPGLDELRLAAGRFDLVFVDPLQRVLAPDPVTPRHQQLEDLMAEFLELGVQHPASWIISSHMARGDGERHVGNIAKGSSAIEYDGDALYCCPRQPDSEDDGIRPKEFPLVFKCFKQREGSELPLQLWVKNGRIVEPEEMPSLTVQRP